MEERDFGPINWFKHERVQKLKLRHSGGSDHVSRVTFGDSVIDNCRRISSSSLAEFLLRVENFYLHLYLSLLKTLPRARCGRSLNRVQYSLILHAIFKVRARLSLLR